MNGQCSKYRSWVAGPQKIAIRFALSIDNGDDEKMVDNGSG